MTYRTGDIPALSLSVVPTVAGNVLDLEPFDSATVTLINPDGTTATGTGTITATLEASDVSIGWPATSWFTVPGVHSVQILLHATGGGVQSGDPFPFVVEQPDGWHTLSSARVGWTTGAPRNDVALYNLLQTAKGAVSAFAPTLADGVQIPQNYRDAQLLQARNSWNATVADPSSNDTNEQFTPVRPFPLDRWVKALLRPVKAVPLFG